MTARCLIPEASARVRFDPPEAPERVRFEGFSAASGSFGSIWPSCERPVG